MSAAALALVLLAGLVHATWNLAAKHAGGGAAFSALSSSLAVIVWAPVGIPVLAGQAPGWDRGQWGAIFASAALHVAYFWALLRGYEVGDLSVVYPIARGTGPLLTVAVSVLFRGERLGPVSLLGVVAIVGGVVLIATGGRFVRSDRLATGVGYGVATGVTIAAYTLLDGHSVQRMDISPIGLDYTSNAIRAVMSVPLAILILHRSDRSPVTFARIHARHAVVVAALSPLAYVLVLQAATLTELSKVAPTREVSMLFAALFAGTLLEETGMAARAAGAVAIGCGVIAVALG